MSAWDNRPKGLQDSGFAIDGTTFNDEAFQGDYLGGTNLIYKGFAKPGSSQTEKVWQIAKCTYDVNNNITAIQWPINATGAASNDYEFQWSLRASYTYV